MMRIICFTISLGSGGAERQLVSLASMLKEKEYYVEVLTYLPDYFYKDFLDSHGVPHKCIDNIKGNWRRFWAIRRIIKSFGADVVIAYLEIPALMGCLMKLLGSKFKLIVSERNTTQKKTWFDKLRFPLMNYADWIVPNSYSQGSFIGKSYPRLTQKVKVITNYVDTESFAPNQMVSEETKLVLTVARINPQKNILRYIEAISTIKEKCNGVVFRWYGSITDEAYYKNCKSKIEELGLQRVFFFERSTNEIIKVYHTASLFCLPSLYEGYPNVVCEAMSCGVPIICSNVCDNSIIVEDGLNGYLFDPNSVESIAKALMDMIVKDNKSLHEMGEKSRRIALEKFSKDRFLNNYIELINA